MGHFKFFYHRNSFTCKTFIFLLLYLEHIKSSRFKQLFLREYENIFLQLIHLLINKRFCGFIIFYSFYFNLYFSTRFKILVFSMPKVNFEFSVSVLNWVILHTLHDFVLFEFHLKFY